MKNYLNDLFYEKRWSVALAAIAGFCFLQISEASSQALMTNDGLTMTVESGLTVTIEGGFTNQTNGTDGSLDNDGNIVVKGDWTNNASAGVVTINADAVGTIELSDGATSIGGTRTTHFENLVINSSTTDITLDEPIDALYSVTLTDGVLNTDATNLLVVEDNATASSGTATSYVDGPMKKIGNDNFTFPLGDGAVWARLAIDNSGSLNTDTEYTAQYFHAKYSDLSIDGTLTLISAIEYWTVSQAVNADNATVKLHWEDAARSDISDYSTDLVVARYNGTDFTSNGHSAITGSDPGDVTSNTVSDFSNQVFTFGSVFGNNTLPIELIDFNAVATQNGVELEWSTAAEIDNDFFTIERSLDTEVWEHVSLVDGAGNSNDQLDYQDVDYYPYTGTSYYRLKQTDFDGQFSFSHVVTVTIDEFGNELIAYPIPTEDIMTVEGAPRDLKNLKIFSQSGQDLSHNIRYVEENARKVVLDVTILKDGIYILNGDNPQKSIRFKKD